MIRMIWKLTAAQFLLHWRDRQTIFFSLFFPLLFMVAIGYMADSGFEQVDIAVIEGAETDYNTRLLDAVIANELLDTQVLPETEARTALEAGDLAMVIILPQDDISVAAGETAPLDLLVNAADPQRGLQAQAILDSVLTRLEHELRGTAPLVAPQTQDVLARDLSYMDFLFPGIMAFMIMTLSITGSGFNIVEYKRKGILKRLFVTPLNPLFFIVSLILTRLATILIQIAIVVGIGIFALQVDFVGSPLLILLFVFAGAILFLSIGFMVGGMAKSQQSVGMIGNLVIFPQVFLASVFFPKDALPGWLQGVSSILPLTYLSDAMRGITNQGMGLVELWPQVLGILVWSIIAIALAAYFFRWSDAADA